MEIQVGQGKGKEVAEQAFYLAWQACGGPAGMGFLQDRPEAAKEEVLLNARHDGDYPGNFRTKEDCIDGDYVFGRMMKLTIRYTDNTVIIPDSEPRPDYQAWCRKYRTYEDLIKAANV